MTCDLINAYFQFRVSPESVHLLAFICPLEKDVMLRIPQGWHESGDWLNVETRCLSAGVSHSLKIMEDLLLQPKSGTEAYKLCAHMLLKAVEKDWKFPKDKFHVSPQVVISGLLLTCTPMGIVSIKPDG